MFLALTMSLLLQTAPDQSTPAAPPVAEQVAEGNTTTTRRSRRARSEALVCDQRAPTGSVMRRSICRSQRRDQADRRIAREYLSEVTRGTVHEPMDLGGS